MLSGRRGRSRLTSESLIGVTVRGHRCHRYCHSHRCHYYYVTVRVTLAVASIDGATVTVTLTLTSLL